MIKYVEADKSDGWYKPVSKVYVVVYAEDYDSYEVSYHKTKKGAYREIMRRQYENWSLCRYVYDYDRLYFTVYENELMD